MLFAVMALSATLVGSLSAQTAGGGAATVLSKDNRVDVASGGAGWAAAAVGQSLAVGDRIRTGEDSRASVRVSDGSVLELDELTTIEIKPPKEGGSSSTLSVPQGAAFFYSQGKSHQVRVETPSANGAIRGTAFLLTVNQISGTTVSMLEGAFELSNSGGRVTARVAEQARVSGGGPARQALADRGDTAPWYLAIESQLPAVQRLGRVGKPQFLSAVPSTITRYREVAPQLAGGAAIVRREWAPDILRESFKAVGGDCAMRGRILRSIIAAVPERAAELTDLAVALGPDCASAFGGGGAPPSQPDTGDDGFGPPPANVLPPPGSIGGGGGQGNVVAICHNGRTLFVSPRGAENHLRAHPGDTLGPCVVTPVQNP